MQARVGIFCALWRNGGNLSPKAAEGKENSRERLVQDYNRGRRRALTELAKGS